MLVASAVVLHPRDPLLISCITRAAWLPSQKDSRRPTRRLAKSKTQGMNVHFLVPWVRQGNSALNPGSGDMEAIARSFAHLVSVSP